MNFNFKTGAVALLALCAISAPAKQQNHQKEVDAAIKTYTSAVKIPSTITMSREQLMNRIKGGWAGQTIGVTYGGPTEFAYRGVKIGDDVNIPWGDPDYIANTMKNNSYLYDDIYMDLTFVEVFDRLGIDAPIDSLAHAFAYARYGLWHANQAARYNIMHGINPPQSGHWINNPHANDIDYQIEADYAGLMAPCMPNTASAISDRVGHIMNYGDGWYGGVYMGAMYSLAFLTDNVEFIVAEALKAIPAKSKFYRCMADVIHTYSQDPYDWKKAWQICYDRWNDDEGCGEGALDPLNIDATMNSAYVIIGLLYGHGDFGRTIDIATRCGQDSDCNPASAGGILGTAMGYDAIEAKWLDPLKRAEDIKFAYTSSSLNDTYRMSFDQALKVITDNGGKVGPDEVKIRCQKPKPVKFEESFPGIEPDARIDLKHDLTAATPEADMQATCCGIVLRADVRSAPSANYVANIDVYIDGVKSETVEMPASFIRRRLDLYWNFSLPMGPHTFRFVWTNPEGDAFIKLYKAVTYRPTHE